MFGRVLNIHLALNILRELPRPYFRPTFYLYTQLKHQIFLMFWGSMEIGHWLETGSYHHLHNFRNPHRIQIDNWLILVQFILTRVRIKKSFFHFKFWSLSRYSYSFWYSFWWAYVGLLRSTKLALAFLRSRFHTWPKSQDKNLSISRPKRAFKMKWKAFFIIIKGLSAAKNCLRPKFYLLRWKAFKNDEKCFSLHVKSSFCSQICKFLSWLFSVM